MWTIVSKMETIRYVIHLHTVELTWEHLKEDGPIYIPEYI